MALKLPSPKGTRPPSTKGVTLTERTFLDADGMATTDRAAGITLLGSAGRVIPANYAAEIGLTKGKAPEAESPAEPETPEAPQEAQSGPETPAEAEPDAQAAEAEPEAEKAVQPAKNKKRTRAKNKEA